MSGTYMKVTSDRTDEFNAIVKKFKNDAVLVGIPADDSERSADKDGESSPITNAALLAINQFGSPINNIPARPVMTIGLRKAAAAISEEFKKAAQQAFTKGFAAVTTYYERAGMIGANSIKKAINDQDGIDPPAESTLKNRASRGFKGTKSLVVSGQMRNSITYVINPGGL